MMTCPWCGSKMREGHIWLMESGHCLTLCELCTEIYREILENGYVTGRNDVELKGD